MSFSAVKPAVSTQQLTTKELTMLQIVPAYVAVKILNLPLNPTKMTDSELLTKFGIQPVAMQTRPGGDAFYYTIEQLTQESMRVFREVKTHKAATSESRKRRGLELGERQKAFWAAERARSGAPL